MMDKNRNKMNSIWAGNPCGELQIENRNAYVCVSACALHMCSTTMHILSTICLMHIIASRKSEIHIAPYTFPFLYLTAFSILIYTMQTSPHMHKLPLRISGVQGLIVWMYIFNTVRKALISFSFRVVMSQHQPWKCCFSQAKDYYQFLLFTSHIDSHPIHRREEITPYSGNGSYFCSFHIMAGLIYKSQPFSALDTCITSSAHSKMLAL